MNDKEKLLIDYIHKHSQKVKLGNEYVDIVKTIELLNILEGKYE